MLIVVNLSKQFINCINNNAVVGISPEAGYQTSNEET